MHKITSETQAMETGVSESANGDQPDDASDSSSYWKLKIPHERILFVDKASSEEFNLLLTALDEAKIVAMDAEWKPVRKAGVSPRVSILQLSCRMDQNSSSWANMERAILSRKIRVEAEESLEARKVQLDAEMQKQKDAIQQQQQKVDRDRRKVQKEGRNVKMQRERFEKERAEKKKRDAEELENSRTWKPSAEDKSTVMKLGDGLKGLFLGRNGEVSEFCEDLESSNPSTEADHKDKSKKVNSDDAEQNVDNLLDVLAQAEKEMLKHQQGEQHTMHTEANLETLSKDTSDIAPNYVSPGKNFVDETSVRSKDTEIEVDKVNRHLDLNNGDNSQEQQMPAKSSDRIDLGLSERDIDDSTTQGVEGRGNAVPPLSNASASQSFKDCSDSFYEASDMEEPKSRKTNLENGLGGMYAASGFGVSDADEDEEDSELSTSEELETQSDNDLDGTVDLIPEKSSRGYNNAAGIEGLTEEENKRVEGEEVIFLLDLMSLSAKDFSSALKKMLCSPQVVKLGFAFKQDQLHLAATFPGPEAHECFDKVLWIQCDCLKENPAKSYQKVKGLGDMASRALQICNFHISH